ncbi:Nonribosomal peptide synthetase 12 [Penicillium rolfsii]|nr:Nonribosomal peptide synthetase 12 [Penicillium rolfsii]
MTKEAKVYSVCHEHSLNVLPKSDLIGHDESISIPFVCPKGPFSPELFVCLSWALVQSQYTGSEDVAFDICLRTLVSSSPCEEEEEKAVTTRNSRELTLGYDSTVHALLEGLYSLQKLRNTEQQISSEPNLSRTLLVVDHATTISEFQRLIFRPQSYLSEVACHYTCIAACLITETSSQISVLQKSEQCAAFTPGRIARQLAHIMGRVLAKPEATISEVLSLHPDDLTDLRKRNGQLPPTVDLCIHDVIKEQARQRPEAIAVTSYEGDMTYQELLDHATQLAKVLRCRGVGPEGFVPLCFHKSRWMTVAILGVLMAGGAFVQLEPAYPLARLESICAVLQSPIILCSSTTTEIAKYLAPDLLVVDGTAHLQELNTPTQVELPRVLPSNAAYAAFTSGSTGIPKGVVIEHRAFCTGAAAHMEQFNFNSASRILQFASYAFDITLVEGLSTFMAGGCLCVLAESERTNSFVDSAKRLQPTHAFLTPSFVRTLTPHDFETVGLGWLIMIGEKVSPKDLASCPPKMAVINGYGPAECTPISTAHCYLRQAATPANVGWSRCGCCWVVDPRDHHRLAPVGAIGELVIEGGHVGREYLDDIDKTRAAFIDSPAWYISMRREGRLSRLYKTGDLVRQLEDGSLVCVGRKGTQVKVRGQRLELEEVETHSRPWFPRARDVIAEVVVPVGRTRDASVVLFVVISPEQVTQYRRHPSSPVILLPNEDFVAATQMARDGLRRVLPGYMVPSFYIPLGELPQTMSGKKDRRHLRESIETLSPEDLAQLVVRVPDSSAEQLSEFESKLRQIWAAELNIPPISIGRADNFFDMGGNSISAMRVAAQARAEGIALLASDLLTRPSLEMQAPHLTALSNVAIDTTPLSLVDMTPATRDEYVHQLREQAVIGKDVEIVDMVPLTGYQTEMLETGGLDCFAFDYTGPICVNRLRQASETVWAQYALLRTIFVPLGERYMQIQLSHAPLRFRHIQTSENVQSLANSLTEEFCRRSSLGPVASHVTLVSHVDGNSHVFIICLSHLHYDGFSLHFLTEDISRAYHGEQGLISRPAFFEYVYFRAQHQHRQAYAFWQEYLRHTSLTPLLEIYHRGDQHPKQGMQWSPMQQAIVPIPNALPTGITLATLVRAAWCLTLAELTGQPEVVFQQTVHGRNSVMEGIDRIFGPCINKLPFCVTIPTLRNSSEEESPTSGATIRSFLHLVQERHSQTLRFDYLDMDAIVARCTDWPAGTRMYWHHQHQNFGDRWSCPLAGMEGIGREIDKGRPPKAESGFANCCLRPGELELTIFAVCTPETVNQIGKLVQQWASFVGKLSDLGWDRSLKDVVPI